MSDILFEKRKALQKEAILNAAISSALPILAFATLAIINWSYASALIKTDMGKYVGAVAIGLVLIGSTIMMSMGITNPNDSFEDIEIKSRSLGPKMTVSMIIFILPAMFMVLIGPTIVDIMNSPTRQTQINLGSNAPYNKTIAMFDATTCIKFGVEKIGGTLNAKEYTDIVDACSKTFMK